MSQICLNCKYFVSFTHAPLGTIGHDIYDFGYCRLSIEESGEPFITRGFNCCEFWEYSGTNVNIQKGKENE